MKLFSSWSPRLIRYAIVVVVVGFALAGALICRPNVEPISVQPKTSNVVLVMVPTLEWVDVQHFNMANIEALSLRANLSIRSIGSRTALNEAYVSISSGNRAGIHLGSNPLILPPLSGCSKALHDAAQRDADAKLYKADPGVFGQTLRDSGIKTYVYGSATSLLTLMDNEGCVDNYELGVPVASVVAAKLQQHSSVVTVELPQLLELWVGANPDVTPSEPIRPNEHEIQMAARKIDAWIGDLVEAVDSNTVVAVVAPTSHPGRTNLTAVALGVRNQQGTLQSGTTRRSGFVTLPDIAPAVLDLFDLQIPTSINGTPFATSKDASLISISTLVTDSEKTTARNLTVGPVSVIFVVAQIVLYLFAALTALRKKRMDHLALRYGMVFIPMVPLIVFLISAFPVYRLSSTAVTLVIYLITLGLTLATLVVFSKETIFRIVVTIVAANWMLQIIDIALSGRLQINTIFGYSATVAGRFQGFGNLSFALMAVSGLVVASIGVLRQSQTLGFSPRGWVLLIGLITLVADGFPWFGADVGGVLAIVPAFGVLWIMADGQSINIKKLISTCLAGLAALAVLAAFDLSRSKESQTHLGRFVRKLFDGDAGVIIERKISANVHMLTSSVWTWLVPIVAIYFIAVAFRSKGALRQVRVKNPGMGALMVSATVLGVLGFAANDSGVVIPAMMFGILVPITLSLLVIYEKDSRI